MLEEEREYYAEHLSEWLNRHAGRVALIKGQQLVGVYDTENDAMSDGARRFGATSFLVRRIIPIQQEVSIPALTLERFAM